MGCETPALLFGKCQKAFVLVNGCSFGTHEQERFNFFVKFNVMFCCIKKTSRERFTKEASLICDLCIMVVSALSVRNHQSNLSTVVWCSGFGTRGCCLLNSTALAYCSHDARCKCTFPRVCVSTALLLHGVCWDCRSQKAQGQTNFYMYQGSWENRVAVLCFVSRSGVQFVDRHRSSYIQVHTICQFNCCSIYSIGVSYCKGNV